jgi:uncharacterized protein YqeY
VDDYVIDGDLVFSDKRSALKFYREQYHKKKEWVGLTDKEREEIAVIAGYDPLRMTVYEYRVAIQIATEAKLKEKNHG